MGRATRLIEDEDEGEDAGLRGSEGCAGKVSRLPFLVVIAAVLFIIIWLINCNPGHETFHGPSEMFFDQGLGGVFQDRQWSICRRNGFGD